jgi:hypothetical protein
MAFKMLSLYNRNDGQTNVSKKSGGSIQNTPTNVKKKIWKLDRDKNHILPA